MKKTLIMSSVFIAVAFASQAAEAGVKVRAGVGSSTYELAGDYGATKVDYTPITLGASYSFDNGMYIDLSYTGGAGKHDGYVSSGYSKQDFKRTDVTLALGRAHVIESNGMAFGYYAGLKSGTTTMGAPIAWGFTEETLTTSGLIVGGGASFPIASGRGGSIGVNLGVGLMGTTWEDNATTYVWNEASDTSVGTSFGLNYNYQFNSTVGVTVDYKTQSYAYDFGLLFGTPNFTIEEKISAIGATVNIGF